MNVIWDSMSPGFRRPDGGGDDSGEVGLRNRSKMAMTRNMEMRMAVATNPKETALTELSKCVQCSSFAAVAYIGAAPLGGGAAHFPHPSSPPIYSFSLSKTHTHTQKHNFFPKVLGFHYHDVVPRFKKTQNENFE